MSDFQDYAVEILKPGMGMAETRRLMGTFLPDGRCETHCGQWEFPVLSSGRNRVRSAWCPA